MSFELSNDWTVFIEEVTWRSDRVELYADKRSLWSVGGLVRSEDASRSSLKDSRLIRRNEQSLGDGRGDGLMLSFVNIG